MSQTCTSCSHENLEIAFFCANCGSKLEIKVDKGKASSRNNTEEKNIDMTFFSKNIEILIGSILIFIVFIVISLMAFNDYKTNNERHYSIIKDKNVKVFQDKKVMHSIDYDKLIIEQNKILNELDDKVIFIKIEKNINKFSLKINLNPFNARVKVLNIKLNYYKGMKFKKGRYHIEVSKKGYISSDRWVEIKEDTNLSITLDKIIKVINIFCLNVTTVPFKTQIKILNIKPKYHDGIKLKEGKYHIEISKKGYISSDRWVEIKEDTNLSITLDKIIKVINIFSLKVTTVPSKTQIKILNIKPKYHDGIKLKKGKYHIEISKKGYKTINKWVSLKKNTSLNIKLNKVQIYRTPQIIDYAEPVITNSVPIYNSPQTVDNIEPVTTPHVAKRMSRKKPNMSHLNREEKQSIEKVCGYDKRQNGPSAYYSCIQGKINSLKSNPTKPSMSHLNHEEKQSIEKVCGYDKRQNGPSAYYSCIQTKLNQL